MSELSSPTVSIVTSWPEPRSCFAKSKPMTACPPLLVLTMRTFFFTSALALTLKAERAKRLEGVGYVREDGVMEREEERAEE